jgi:hypothetical protein
MSAQAVGDVQTKTDVALYVRKKRTTSMSSTIATAFEVQGEVLQCTRRPIVAKRLEGMQDDGVAPLE